MFDKKGKTIKSQNKEKVMKRDFSTDLSTVGEVIHRQAAVQTQSQPKVTQAARQVVLYQDVGALQVSVDYGHL